MILSFNYSNGMWPAAGMVFGSNGALYGTTKSGANGAGTIFELVPPATSGGTGSTTVIYSFPGGDHTTIHTPDGQVLFSPDGTLYTTTEAGGVIALAPPTEPGRSWTESTIYTVEGDLYGLTSGLVLKSGTLYGTGYDGGGSGCGGAYALQPPLAPGGAWTETELYGFEGPPNDGCGPSATLTVGLGGVLYGATYYGGSGTVCYLFGLPGEDSGCGTVFQLTPPSTTGGIWTKTTLYAFTGENGDGAYPSSNLMWGSGGVLYGTTQYGGTAASVCSYWGATGCGTVFELLPPAAPGGPWTEKVLHSFMGGQDGDGAVPFAGLTPGPNGVFFGTTSAGGYAGHGTVFSIKPCPRAWHWQDQNRLVVLSRIL